MWLTQKLKRTESTKMTSGQVTGGEEFAVRGEQEYVSPEMLFPYGFSSQSASGRQAVMLNGVCAGISSVPDSSLKEGEVKLYSAGGAEILLNNAGEVIINGQVFSGS